MSAAPQYPRPKTRTLILNDGESCVVPTQDYPWIMEWLWTYDQPTGLVYRIEHGKTVVLYHELLRKHATDEEKITLDDTALDRLFSQFGAWDLFLTEWQERVELAAGKEILLPDPYDYLGVCLSAAILLYDQWVARGKFFVHDCPKGGKGGTLREGDFTLPLPKDMQYRTLGEWMYAELTGHWDGEDDEDFAVDVAMGTVAPSPELYADMLQFMMEQMLDTMIDELNGEKDIEDIVEFFEEQEASLDTIMMQAHFLIQTYRTPSTR